MNTLKILYRRWMAFAEAWGQVMSTLIFGAFYLVLFGWFTPFLRRSESALWKNPLAGSQESFWIPRPKRTIDVESLSRMS